MTGLILALLVAGPTEGRVITVKARPALKAEAPAHWTRPTRTVTVPEVEAVTETTRPRLKAQRRTVRVWPRLSRADYRCLMDSKCRALVRDLQRQARREARRHRTRRSMAAVAGPRRDNAK